MHQQVISLVEERIQLRWTWYGALRTRDGEEHVQFRFSRNAGQVRSRELSHVWLPTWFGPRSVSLVPDGKWSNVD